MNPIPIHDLSAPFALEQVKQRKGNFGQQLSYLETPVIIGRLNEALEGAWSFQVVETMVEVDEVIVRGRLTIGDTVREQFGGSRITRHKDNGEMISLGDDLKAATSDALKKCATLAGVGLHLYTEPTDSTSNGNGHNSGARNGHSNGGGNGNAQGRGNGHARQVATPRSWNGSGNYPSASDRVTHEQITRIFSAARDAGLPQKAVIALVRDSFATTISLLSPAQADDLITLIGQAA